MKHKVFIDGSAGTTGLRIYERLAEREDIELLALSEQNRKNLNARVEMINSSDITFLCLPDAAAKEIVPLVSQGIALLDTSTAHRTNDKWTYGMPELFGGQQRLKIKSSHRIAVPGCHASGFISLVAPLVESKIAPCSYPFTAHSQTGYSGGGKGMIADYVQNGRDDEHLSPRQYALTQVHKHLPEMQKMCGLTFKPLLNPIVANFYCGMVVTVPLFTRLLAEGTDCERVCEAYRQYYKSQPLIKVHEAKATPANGFLAANALVGSDGLEIFVFGNEEQIVVTSRFDNLGKGSSGAAIQCMNILLNNIETKGLVGF